MSGNVGIPPNGAAIYWKYRGSPHKNSGYVVHLNDSGKVRLARWPNDTAGIVVNVNQIEWMVKKNG